MSQQTINGDVSTTDNNNCEASRNSETTSVILSVGRSDLVSCSSTTALLEECFQCTLCSQVLKNKRGLNQHLRCCRNKVQESNLNHEFHF